MAFFLKKKVSKIEYCHKYLPTGNIAKFLIEPLSKAMEMYLKWQLYTPFAFAVYNSTGSQLAYYFQRPDTCWVLNGICNICEILLP